MTSREPATARGIGPECQWIWLIMMGMHQQHLCVSRKSHSICLPLALAPSCAALHFWCLFVMLSKSYLPRRCDRKDGFFCKSSYRLVWLFPITPAPRHLALLPLIKPPKEKERFHARAKLQMVDVSRLSSANMLLGHQIAGLVLHNKDHKSNVCPPKNWMMFEQFANAGKNMFMQKCLSIPCQNIAKHTLWLIE